MSGRLGQAELARLAGRGTSALDAEQGMALLERARGAGRAVLVAPLDLRRWRCRRARRGAGLCGA